MTFKRTGRILAILILLGSSSAWGGSFFRYGVGVLEPGSSGVADEKSFSLGYEEDWFGPFIHQYELGVYTDQSQPGRTASGFGNYSVGVEVNPGVFVARSLWGVGAITNPDTVLGGWFQFNQDLLLGIKDQKGNMIGLDFKHISSAGIEEPNTGRNFVLVHVEIPW